MTTGHTPSTAVRLALLPPAAVVAYIRRYVQGHAARKITGITLGYVVLFVSKHCNHIWEAINVDVLFY